MGLTSFQQALQDLGYKTAAALRRCSIKYAPEQAVCAEFNDVQKAAEDLDVAIAGGSGGGSIIPILASVALVGQTAGVGTTTVFTTPNDGVNHIYRVSIYTYCQASGTGNNAVNVLWTRPDSVAHSSALGVSFPNTAQEASITSLFSAKPNTAVQYSITYVSTGTYAAFLAWEQLT